MKLEPEASSLVEFTRATMTIRIFVPVFQDIQLLKWEWGANHHSSQPVTATFHTSPPKVHLPCDAVTGMNFTLDIAQGQVDKTQSDAGYPVPEDPEAKGNQMSINLTSTVLSVENWLKLTLVNKEDRKTVVRIMADMKEANNWP